MPRCLMLAPFPLARPRHGGQVRAASLAKALSMAGWQVDTVGLFHADQFHTDDWGTLDIVSNDPLIAERVATDVLFADLHVATAAAADAKIRDQLRMTLRRLRPDVIQVEHPWSWPILCAAVEGDARPRLVYSSHNIEWAVRRSLLDHDLGLNRTHSDRLLERTRVLETEIACAADLVLSNSDVEAVSIASTAHRAVVHVPAVSDLADQRRPSGAAFNLAARERRCRYAALMGSAYWPNVEGFFSLFPHGLGFLAQGEQIWVAGSLGPALCDDPRYQDYRSVNDARLRVCGHVDDADKPAFFAAASCVIAPVQIGGGAKQKTADALASSCPVIATSHALAGYGPLIQDALDNGIYIADAPQPFRALIRRALREGLAACPSGIRALVGVARMAETLEPLYAALLGGAR